MTVRNEKEMVKHIVDLWYETQMGHYLKCQKKQHELADLMWKLYVEFHPEDDG
tara:strand:+ start:535 stop:693 length:159 start_codon:yes stop_codon:yes gene_type:complete